MSLELFDTPQWGPKGLLELYENIFRPVFPIFGAIPGRHQEISHLSARILTDPPPSGVKVCFSPPGPGRVIWGTLPPILGMPSAIVALSPRQLTPKRHCEVQIRSRLTFFYCIRANTNF